jgi:hypothetical protein
MVTNKTISDLDFKTMDDYMDYVVESKINGNYSQAKLLIDKFSKQQKIHFISYLENENNSEDIKWCKNKTIELI